MGNCCGKESKSSDPFEQPGRTLGSAPPPSANQRASVPARANVPGRTLGGANPNQDPREAAAKAAQDRAAATNKPKTGKLGQQLDEQRRQTRATTLKAESEENRRARDADTAAQAQRWE
ncbi:hypothetical protein L228DRAFT_279606 [Xylona heveae TC161]|uniref:Uncharacterized protein n=1 Tax=Xylona heveae (strain CBS 132557 / TC161) TaxID=1328760 RepID=A0A165JLQ8_XYLHT|nr:hypothetical protein L228DRAFT_279606 [Xylona heveae TC161]KZF26399.1 hypothetical protein L228DRAFT_279606 [Xylona heveae TC161]